MKPLLVGALVAAVVVPLSAVVPSASARTAPGVAGGQIEARVGNLTVREGAGTGARRVASASVRQDLVRDRVSATVVLDAVPTAATAATAATLSVVFGTYDGDVCAPTFASSPDVFRTPTTGTPATGFTRSGRTIKLDLAYDRAGYMDWDCAGAIASDGASTLYSSLDGRLVDVAARPDLAVTKVQLLGKGKVGLLRGVWTTLEVTVANRGTADSTGTVVTGTGKGLKIRRAGLGTIGDDDTGTARVQVKLVGAKATRLRLAVKGGGDRATRTVRVRSVAAPPKPTAGRYTGAGGDVRFKVVKGRVSGFRIYTQTRCGAYPDVPTTTFNTYEFPTTRIARNGIVDARQKGRLFSAYLRLRIAKGTVTQARFQYFGPNHCRASESFTARRVGR